MILQLEVCLLTSLIQALCRHTGCIYTSLQFGFVEQVSVYICIIQENRYKSSKTTVPKYPIVFERNCKTFRTWLANKRVYQGVKL